ncbi:hypothetical protein ACF090_33720 [Streptomyces sp. NPDC014892]|uniref:hypothetical protein n=1 Tax=Streptomyces sp. NPDC014892 TaxID=3364930 RepID=UPI0036F89E1E
MRSATVDILRVVRSELVSGSDVAKAKAVPPETSSGISRFRRAGWAGEGLRNENALAVVDTGHRGGLVGDLLGHRACGQQ